MSGVILRPPYTRLHLISMTTLQSKALLPSLLQMRVQSGYVAWPRSQNFVSRELEFKSRTVFLPCCPVLEKSKALSFWISKTGPNSFLISNTFVFNKHVMHQCLNALQLNLCCSGPALLTSCLCLYTPSALPPTAFTSRILRPPDQHSPHPTALNYMDL